MFPKFLLPSIIFHPRRHNANHLPSTRKADTHGNGNNRYLTGHVSCLRCSKCGAELCLKPQIISKGFTGRHGRAYLAESLPNTVMQRPVPRQYVTGLHTVCDISCAFCGNVLGWKYVSAEEESQRYKIGKFILETKRIAMSSSWESPCNTNQNVSPGHLSSEPSENINRDEHIEFDSQDEDECEDIFAGIWSPSLAMRRRSRKLDRYLPLFRFPS
ncbi:yippee/mis18 family protein [Aspergillus novofumigatus IBT 16806]|uniref:Yippee family protein n=1 Tax=Aspergillus novofumigatus (strain IBT 16806) TaxID=1392255 RepID=A0A2I1CLQ3_ASPN1|nr:yippee family protein [Aspergillus novofumigatus IBT 16806]PKX98553.1 yippee family protein [Aspergillus novofumigatus IBT 16806]